MTTKITRIVAMVTPKIIVVIFSSFDTSVPSVICVAFTFVVVCTVVFVVVVFVFVVGGGAIGILSTNIEKTILLFRLCLCLFSLFTIIYTGYFWP